MSYSAFWDICLYELGQKGIYTIPLKEVEPWLNLAQEGWRRSSGP